MFKFQDKVKIVSGFYQGNIGTVIDADVEAYTVQIWYSVGKSGEKKISKDIKVKGKDLELIEEPKVENELKKQVAEYLTGKGNLKDIMDSQREQVEKITGIENSKELDPVKYGRTVRGIWYQGKEWAALADSLIEIK